MRVHVLGIPHTVTSPEFLTCAFTQKARKLAAMLTRRGHDVVHYGVEGSDVECSENVAIVSRRELDAAYPHPGTGNYEHADQGSPARSSYLAHWIIALGDALRKRVTTPHAEIVAVTWGGQQWDALSLVTTPHFAVESGIGYPLVRADYRVYESYAWLHMHLGRDGYFGGEKWYWGVIPNAFELEEFTFSAKRGEEFLFLGRLNRDKGVGEAIGAAKRIGAPIRIVGQGDPAPWLALGSHVRYEEPAGLERRRELLAQARAVVVPSFYVEPFCGVAVEAQLSGAPVVTSDWGAFAETVLHGRTGYRIRTVEQLDWAMRNVERIDPHTCRAWAAQNYSMARIARMYEEFFQQVLNVRTGKNPHTEGFYAPHPGRRELGWLERAYPLAATRALDVDGPHIAPEPPSEWSEAQDWERDWWGLDWAPHWDDEIRKQEDYFRLMGLPSPRPGTGGRARGWRSLGRLRILDVGCGPVSVLQRSSHGPSRGVDPLAVSDETRRRYAAAGVDFLNMKAEDMPEDGAFDEAWSYNCLQHVDDPDVILAKMGRMAPAVRIFEWLVTEKYPGHPQLLTEELFARNFPEAQWDRRIWNVGTLRDPVYGGVTRYLALYAVRR